jgi:hypothetical protein
MDETWPHPEVGEDWDGVATRRGRVLVPPVHADGRLVSGGKSYSAEEWRVVGGDVGAFISRRNRDLIAIGALPDDEVLSGPDALHHLEEDDNDASGATVA